MHYMILNNSGKSFFRPVMLFVRMVLERSNADAACLAVDWAERAVWNDRLATYSCERMRFRCPNRKIAIAAIEITIELRFEIVERQQNCSKIDSTYVEKYCANSNSNHSNRCNFEAPTI